VTLDLYKSGSTISLLGHDTKLQKMLGSRDQLLLPSRGPAYPAHALDLSYELAAENHSRRRQHRNILDQNPTAFRRKDKPESASGELHQRQIMRDLLGEMHQLKDYGDINKSKRYTRSILVEKTMRDTRELDEYHFQTMKPLDDFIRPDDQASPRLTGYDSGHVRSILKLDVYGPASSAAISREREQGSKPVSPNVDRHLILDPGYSLRSPQDSNSRASSANSTSYNGAFPQIKTIRRRGNSASGMANSTEGMQKFFHSSSAQALGGTGGSGGRLHVAADDPGVDFAGEAGLIFGGRRSAGSRASKNGGSRGHFPGQTFPGVAISQEERMQGGDPFLRRTSWYRNYAEQKKNNAQYKKDRAAEKKRMIKQSELAERERQIIVDFENYLQVSKFST